MSRLIYRAIEIEKTRRDYKSFKKEDGTTLREEENKIDLNVGSIKERQPAEEGFRKTYELEVYYNLDDPTVGDVNRGYFRALLDRRLNDFLDGLNEDQRQNIQITEEVGKNLVIVSVK